MSALVSKAKHSGAGVFRSDGANSAIPRVARIVLVLLSTLLVRHCFAQTLIFNETAPEFGAVPLRQRSTQKTLSITNHSQVPVLIEEITVDGDFEQSDNCKMWLPEGSGCLISLVFTPSATGVRTGKLTVSLIGAAQQSITVSGFGLSQKGADSTHVQDMSSTSNAEEKAQQLLNDKKYTFEDMLGKDPGAVSNAKAIFALTNDTEIKERVASILLSVGIHDEIYFDYLTGEAKKALAHDHDTPLPFLYGEQKLPTGANPAFNDWCKAHGVGFWSMEKIYFYQIPVAWYFLGAAADPRSYDLLISGLHSQNLMIVSWAATGLAKLQDPRAIPELIAVGREATGQALSGIVQSLLYFPDPKAQAAAEELLPQKQKNLLDVYRTEKKQSGIKGLFGW